MGYLKIPNLYKEQDILMFKECYALEKLHGTSAHIGWNKDRLVFFTGDSHPDFVKLFDHDALEKFFRDNMIHSCRVYGEHYGGKIQGMKHTYGIDKKFAVFDVLIDGLWLNVPNAADVAGQLGLEFVHWEKISTDVEALDAARAAPSVQAKRNGIEGDRESEGVVLRPLVELRKNNDDRIIVKHKNDSFRETLKPRKVIDVEKLALLTNADEIATEWVTPMRLQHVLQKFPEEEHRIENTSNIIRAMVEDVERESVGEAEIDRLARSAIGRHTAVLFKQYLKSQLEN